MTTGLQCSLPIVIEQTIVIRLELSELFKVGWQRYIANLHISTKTSLDNLLKMWMVVITKLSIPGV